MFYKTNFITGFIIMEHILFSDGQSRCVLIAEYIIENNSTVRRAAKVFGISKSTIHKDITVALEKKDVLLANEVKKVLEKNKSERHIRGGEATRKKYMELKESEKEKSTKE